MTKRRVKGEGSVYRRKDGRCLGEYVDANGKRRYVSGKTKPEVKAKLRKLLEDRDKGIAYDAEGLTVERYMDRWLESIRDKVRLGTLKPYEAITRLHIKPTLGKVKLEKLTALQLETLYREKLGEGLSARRVRYVHVTIRKALKDAVRLQLLPRNVADAAIPPIATTRKIKPLTQEQLRILLAAAKETQPRLYALYVLAITTGMRQGELLGLQWKDIDLDTATLTVSRSVYEGVISPPKTEAGNRTIKLSRMAIGALRQHRIDAAKVRMSEWVFPNSRGTTIGHQNLHNRSWKPLLKHVGFPHSTRFHDLRHSCISLLLARAVPIKVVSEMSGHADVSITLSVYGHTLPNQQGACAEEMEETLGGSL
jgi:integrase